MIRAAAFAGALLVAAVTPAVAQTDRAKAFADIAERSVSAFIRPGYERLADLAQLEVLAVETLCRAPSAETLAAAQESFRALALGWSRISLIRFGPVAEDNRFERLWFFPDRKGLALRQVQGLLAERDEAALVAGALADKSVALQGLPALEYALFGTDADRLARPNTATYRCRFAHAVARNVAAIAARLGAEWDSETGYAQTMLRPGPGNALYRSSDEVVRALLGAMTGQIVFVRDIGLLPVLGVSPSKARPKRAAFWRSARAIAALRANVWSVLQLYETAGFSEALDEEHRYLEGQIPFEFSNVLEAFDRVQKPITEAATDETDRPYLLYATVALRNALAALGNYYAEGIGISMGFNALDGD